MMSALYDNLPSVLRCLEARGDCEELKDELAKLDADTRTHKSMLRLTRLLANEAIEWATEHVPGDKEKAAKKDV